MSNKSKLSELDHATRLVRRICQIAGDPRLIDKLSRDLARRGVRSAIRHRDTPVLFDWLLETISYQGIGNHVAHGYMQRHGRTGWNEIAALVEPRPSCPKLQSYWHFDHCGYQKIEQCCAQPDHFPACPLPTHDLRNGRLNQAAYSLFLFMRDVANGDFVGWIDRRLADADVASAPDRAARLRQAVIEPLTHAYGVSNKVLSMTLAGFLLAGDTRRTLWIEAGAVMIAVDTLVHNFLHRTGILARLGARHLYGTDGEGKPRAARFAKRDTELAMKAARLLGFRAVWIEDAAGRVIADVLPDGNVFARGNGFVRLVRQSAFDKLSAAVDGDAAAATPEKAEV